MPHVGPQSTFATFLINHEPSVEIELFWVWKDRLIAMDGPGMENSMPLEYIDIDIQLSHEKVRYLPVVSNDPGSSGDEAAFVDIIFDSSVHKT